MFIDLFMIDTYAFDYMMIDIDWCFSPDDLHAQNTHGFSTPSL